jgi:hypothetical protein
MKPAKFLGNRFPIDDIVSDRCEPYMKQSYSTHTHTKKKTSSFSIEDGALINSSTSALEQGLLLHQSQLAEHVPQKILWWTELPTGL